MASEISLTASLSVYKASVMAEAIGMSIPAGIFTMTGNYYAKDSMLVLTSATLIPMGQVITPHWSFFKNLDSTNYIKIRNGASGADVLRLYPGEAFPCPLDPTGTYYAIADTASCLMAYCVFSL